jgi:hypothetical protein
VHRRCVSVMLITQRVVWLLRLEETRRTQGLVMPQSSSLLEELLRERSPCDLIDSCGRAVWIAPSFFPGYSFFDRLRHLPSFLRHTRFSNVIATFSSPPFLHYANKPASSLDVPQRGVEHFINFLDTPFHHEQPLIDLTPHSKSYNLESSIATDARPI